MPQHYGHGAKGNPVAKEFREANEIEAPQLPAQTDMRGQATEPMVPSQLDPTPPRDEQTKAAAGDLDRVASVVEFLVASLYERGGISKEEFDMLNGVLGANVD